MPSQCKREPLLPEEATRLAQACQAVREKLVVWVLLDTGLRVSELASLTPAQIDWQGHRLTIDGKGGPYGSRSKRRIIPLSARLQPLIEPHFAVHDRVGLTPRAMQLLVKRMANRARISRPVTPHVRRHTFAVTAVRKGLSLPALQRLLGHDRLTTTEIDLNRSPEAVVRACREQWRARAVPLSPRGSPRVRRAVGNAADRVGRTSPHGRVASTQVREGSPRVWHSRRV